MKSCRLLLSSVLVVLLPSFASLAEVKVVVDRNDAEQATPQFKFAHVPAPAKQNAARGAKFTIIDGQRDQNGGDPDVLHDGALPPQADHPESNFFFNAGTEGGRLLIDLGKAIEIKQIDTYSWHPTTRAPQVYKLYGSDGRGQDFKAEPKKDVAPETCGWKLIANVDTRPKDGEPGGQYGVSVADSAGPVGRYRYLLLDVSRTEDADDFGNTFYSEIVVVDQNAPPAEPVESPKPFVIKTPDGKCEITIDTSGAPDLTDWADQKLAPVLAEWYPKLTAMLPSEGYTPPDHFTVFIRNGPGVAATSGTRVWANAKWFRGELNGQAIGALVHEEVHVVQQYGRARRNNPNATRAPGWLVEGIPDYIRWYLYEPQSHGADITTRSAAARARYNGMYRISANFLNWVTNKYDKDIVRKLNAACREGTYTDEMWKKDTGKTIDELNSEWKATLPEKRSS